MGSPAAGTLGIRDLAAYGRLRFDPGFSYVLPLVLSFTFSLCGRIALSAPGMRMPHNDGDLRRNRSGEDKGLFV